MEGSLTGLTYPGSNSSVDAQPSDQENPVWQLVSLSRGWEVLGQDAAAFFDRRDKALGDRALFCPLEKLINRLLPDRWTGFGCDALVGNDARVPLGERNEDQNAGPVFLARHAADHELLHRGAMGCRPLRPARNEQTADRGLGEHKKKNGKNENLRNKNLPHRKLGEGEQKPGGDERDERRPGGRIAHIVGSRLSEHADNLARCLRLSGLDRCIDSPLVFSRKTSHHQSPEAPPPPDEPPPPEKPPPEKPPSYPPPPSSP